MQASVDTAKKRFASLQKCVPWSEGTSEADSSSSSGAVLGGPGDGSHVIICSAAGVGCVGRLRLLLTWRCAAQLHPDISAELALDPLQVDSLLSWPKAASIAPLLPSE